MKKLPCITLALLLIISAAHIIAMKAPTGPKPGGKPAGSTNAPTKIVPGMQVTPQMLATSNATAAKYNRSISARQTKSTNQGLAGKIVTPEMLATSNATQAKYNQAKGIGPSKGVQTTSSSKFLDFFSSGKKSTTKENAKATKSEGLSISGEAPTATPQGKPTMASRAANFLGFKGGKKAPLAKLSTKTSLDLSNLGKEAATPPAPQAPTKTANPTNPKMESNVTMNEAATPPASQAPAKPAKPTKPKTELSSNKENISAEPIAQKNAKATPEQILQKTLNKQIENIKIVKEVNEYSNNSKEGGTLQEVFAWEAKNPEAVQQFSSNIKQYHLNQARIGNAVHTPAYAKARANLKNQIAINKAATAQAKQAAQQKQEVMAMI